jgi:hypothetical protein
LKNWTSNQNQAVVKLNKRERTKTGRLLFSTNKALQVALIHRLGELGIRPSEAAEIASAFTMRGSGGGAFIERDDPQALDELKTRREPGKLFPSGLTLLVIRPGFQTNVVNLSGDPSIDQLLGSSLGATVLNLNEIDKNVRSSLAAAQDDGELEKPKVKNRRAPKELEAA